MASYVVRTSYQRQWCNDVFGRVCDKLTVDVYAQLQHLEPGEALAGIDSDLRKEFAAALPHYYPEELRRGGADKARRAFDRLMGRAPNSARMLGAQAEQDFSARAVSLRLRAVFTSVPCWYLDDGVGTQFCSQEQVHVAHDIRYSQIELEQCRWSRRAWGP